MWLQEKCNHNLSNRIQQGINYRLQSCDFCLVSIKLNNEGNEYILKSLSHLLKKLNTALFDFSLC